MSATELAVDLDRLLESAANDVGEAQQLRRRLASDTQLRRAVRTYADRAGAPDTLAPHDAAKQSVARFLLGRDAEVGDYARHGDAHRVLYLWGLAEIHRDRAVLARDALRLCLEREPRDEQARLQLAAIEALTGRPDTAREILGPLAGQTDRPQVLYCLGTIAEAEGDYATAREHYEGAHAQDPEHVDSLFRLAYQHDLSGDDDAAIALYERARRVKPVRANVLVNLGVLYEDRNEYDKAADCYRYLLQREPNHPRARHYLRDAESSQSMVLDADIDRKEDRRNQLLRTPISDFELSVRSRNCLAKMNIQSLGDLITRSEAELLSYKNFGETSLQEIKEILASKGLRLGMRREEVLLGPEPGPAALTLPDIPEDEGPESGAVLLTPVADLDLSVRSAKCMTLLNVETLGDLVRYSEQELLRMKNFGVTSLQEIKTKLAAFNLSLKKA